MIIVKRGYKRTYQVGGSGIFSKLKDFLSPAHSKFITKKQVDTALNIAKSAGRTARQKAVDVASKLTPKSQAISSKLVSSQPQGTAPQVAQSRSTLNLNNLIAGSGERKRQRAIKIQDLVSGLNK